MLQGLETGWRGWASGGADTHTKKLCPIPDLLEELRLMLFKMSQFVTKILTFKVSTFWIPEIRRIPTGGQHHKRA